MTKKYLAIGEVYTQTTAYFFLAAGFFESLAAGLAAAPLFSGFFAVPAIVFKF
jgi:hypothetical protein